MKISSKALTVAVFLAMLGLPENFATTVSVQDVSVALSEDPSVVGVQTDSERSPLTKVLELAISFLGIIVAAGVAIWVVHAEFSEQRRQAWRSKAAVALGMAESACRRGNTGLLDRRVLTLVDARRFLEEPTNPGDFVKRLELEEGKRAWERWVDQVETTVAALSEAAGQATAVEEAQATLAVRDKLLNLEDFMELYVYRKYRQEGKLEDAGTVHEAWQSYLSARDELKQGIDHLRILAYRVEALGPHNPAAPADR